VRLGTRVRAGREIVTCTYCRVLLREQAAKKDFGAPTQDRAPCLGQHAQLQSGRYHAYNSHFTPPPLPLPFPWSFFLEPVDGKSVFLPLVPPLPHPPPPPATPRRLLPSAFCLLDRSVFLGITVSLLVSQYLLRKEKSAAAALNAFGDGGGDKDVEVGACTLKGVWNRTRHEKHSKPA